MNSCNLYDSIRTWGERDRRAKVKQLTTGELDQWSRDLEISRDHASELHLRIQELVQESAHHGQVSWKIARAYMDQGRYRMAEEYFKGAMENRLVDSTGKMLETSSLFESALPYYTDALRRNQVDPQLLFDAGLCYANSSRELGWNGDRWRVAVLLFETMRARLPRDPRPLYELGLLYGKTTNPDLRDSAKAIDLLKETLDLNPDDVGARFALAHIVAETGDLSGAREETRRIMQSIEEMKGAGLIQGNLEKNRQYVQARENLEKLDTCIENKPGCEIFFTDRAPE